MEQLAAGLFTILKNNKIIFLRAEPEIIDFTKHEDFKLFIYGKEAMLQTSLNRENLIRAIGILEETIFADKITLICWNIKNIISAVWHYTGKKVAIDAKVVDLRIIENYLGDRETKTPKSYNEAMDRLKIAAKKDEWKKIYQKIHLPLITDVVPSMEVSGLIDKANRKVLYPYYEIEGQRHGRMKCKEAFSNVFNPHTMNHNDGLYPVGHDNLFMVFDFKHMEVSVLQWLSGDSYLEEVMEEGPDFYKSLFKVLTGKECNQDKYRNFAKSVFLPIIFGLSSKTLVTEHKISENFANHTVDTINSKFPLAMAFVQKHQHDEIVVDYLGRVKKSNSVTSARNFVIQSPASTVCLEKLIQLRESLRNQAILGFQVHDGYYIYVKKDKCNYVGKMAQDVLKKPSELLPGLTLKVSCKIGSTLNNLSDTEG
jgi:DNA polymerase I-like protein with 3'-5' exonuclease and polymerase domains